jgi:hypothetical protein
MPFMAESIRSPEAYLFTVAQHVLQQNTLKMAALPSAELAASSQLPLRTFDDQAGGVRTVRAESRARRPRAGAGTFVCREN